MFRQFKKGQPAIILGESMMALAIAAISAVFLMIGLNGLNQQQKQADVRLMACRLSKEAGDEFKEQKHRVSIVQASMTATADQDQVVVEQAGRCILKLERR